MSAPIVATAASPIGQPGPRDRLTPAWLLSRPGSKVSAPDSMTAELANGVDEIADGLRMAFVAVRSSRAGDSGPLIRRQGNRRPGATSRKEGSRAGSGQQTLGSRRLRKLRSPASSAASASLSTHRFGIGSLTSVSQIRSSAAGLAASPASAAAFTRAVPRRTHAGAPGPPQTRRWARG